MFLAFGYSINILNACIHSFHKYLGGQMIVICTDQSNTKNHTIHDNNQYIRETNYEWFHCPPGPSQLPIVYTVTLQPQKHPLFTVSGFQQQKHLEITTRVTVY